MRPAAIDQYRRVISVCSCGREHIDPGPAAKTTTDAHGTYHWWDCSCGSGQVAVEEKGRLLTAVEAEFFFARLGVGR